MSGVKIYQGQGGWIYELWFQGRCIVMGCCESKEQAEIAATM